MISFHHIAIQTRDLDNCLAWYRDYFGVEEKWTLDEFSPLTLSRLPGITRLTEVRVGDVRLHLFERADLVYDPVAERAAQFQHVCVATESPQELSVRRDRWIEVFESKNYAFARPDQPTEIVVDDEGIQSFYLFDVNGLEFEFTYVPVD
ncbi:catechol 2,3-dioxygenase-like lactoylglutathione lyase family enzyme [Nocardia tenerifensis]|uniref:Catechol 2,3-dioxygenase-like lactoylglutathione lyase family enzyme n=1 Tax=Nocardia tenerifensis TaxID=228006 RepID=A0A318JSX2_9NOCA|nr:VOC family protein [Nocardia tenerifensis]PXX56278.1 catechol 2,3-dioxygenase-like lactoylglutathione lyase family enzyme [Nocardia tenerifensis]